MSVQMWEVRSQTSGGDAFDLRVREGDLAAVIRALIDSRVMWFDARPESDPAVFESMTAEAGELET